MSVQVFLDELASAIREHAAPFAIEDVASVEDGWKLDNGDYASTDIEGVVVLKDGRRFKVTGWCDTTGWDCRSGLECEVRRRLDQRTIDDLDPGIRETVVWLNALGYETCDSGDGKTKFEAGSRWNKEFLRDHAHVVIKLRRASDILVASRQLKADIEALGISVKLGGVTIQATFDPRDESALIDVMYLDDRELARARS